MESAQGIGSNNAVCVARVVNGHVLVLGHGHRAESGAAHSEGLQQPRQHHVLPARVIHGPGQHSRYEETEVGVARDLTEAAGRLEVAGPSQHLGPVLTQIAEQVACELRQAGPRREQVTGCGVHGCIGIV